MLLVVVSLSLFAEEPTEETQRKNIRFPGEQGKNRVVLGATLGFPIGIGVTSGWYSNPIAVRISGGMNFTGWQGVQLDCSHLVWIFQSTRHDVSLTGGVFRYENLNDDGSIQFNNQTYVGSNYSVFFKGFHIQAGFAYGIEDYSHYILLFQAGYLLKIF